MVLLKPNFSKYNAKAQEVREVLADYDSRFESASIDEAYLNITAYCDQHQMEPAEVVAQMRQEVAEKTKITVSAGIAANAKIAKICSNMNKPNGQYVVPNDRTAIMAFMKDLPCRKVNGVGRVFERELAAVGIKTCGDIYEHRQYLSRLFGDKAFEFLVHCYLGIGRTKVQPAEEYERKSVGTESTFGEISDPGKRREKLRWTADELEQDMRRAECKGRTLVLKVKLHTFEVYTRQVVTPKAIYLADDIYNLALPILAKLEQEMPGLRIRLLGLRCTHLVSMKKPDTLAFFGFKPRRGGESDTDPLSASSGKRKAVEVSEGEPEWERWPEEELDGYEIDDGAEEDPDMVNGSPYRRHGKEVVPNPKKESPAPPDEWWDCPICGRPQAADEKLLNEHIDLCLSRQVIRDTVQKDALDAPASVPRAAPPETTKRAKTGPEKKRGRTAAGTDPRQKKLLFG